jgi:hypothetical protein
LYHLSHLFTFLKKNIPLTLHTVTCRQTPKWWGFEPGSFDPEADALPVELPRHLSCLGTSGMDLYMD